MPQRVAGCCRRRSLRPGARRRRAARRQWRRPRAGPQHRHLGHRPSEASRRSAGRSISRPSAPLRPWQDPRRRRRLSPRRTARRHDDSIALDPRELLRHHGVEASRHHRAGHDAARTGRARRCRRTARSAEAGADHRQHRCRRWRRQLAAAPGTQSRPSPSCRGHGDGQIVAGQHAAERALRMAASPACTRGATGRVMNSCACATGGASGCRHAGRRSRPGPDFSGSWAPMVAERAAARGQLSVATAAVRPACGALKRRSGRRTSPTQRCCTVQRSILRWPGAEGRPGSPSAPMSSGGTPAAPGARRSRRRRFPPSRCPGSSAAARRSTGRAEVGVAGQW